MVATETRDMWRDFTETGGAINQGYCILAGLATLLALPPASWAAALTLALASHTLTPPFSRRCSYHYNGNAETYWWMGKRPADAIAKMKGWAT